MEKENEIMTVEEVMEWLKITKRSVNDWIKKGQLPAFKIGKTIRIKRSDIDGLFNCAAVAE